MPSISVETCSLGSALKQIAVFGVDRAGRKGVIERIVVKFRRTVQNVPDVGAFV